MGTGRLELKTEAAIALGILVPLLVCLVACLCVCACRRYRNQQPAVRGYSKVGDDLDEEEIEFKRMIEHRADEGGANDDGEEEDVENLFGADEFSDRDKDRLSMLENFRSNLVKGAASFNNRDSESDSETDKMRL